MICKPSVSNTRWTRLGTTIPPNTDSQRTTQEKTTLKHKITTTNTVTTPAPTSYNEATVQINSFERKSLSPVTARVTTKHGHDITTKAITQMTTHETKTSVPVGGLEVTRFDIWTL